MNENRRQILEMLAAGKITADEAEQPARRSRARHHRNRSTFTGKIAGSDPSSRIYRENPREVSTCAG